jgi:F-type H+-transporting ATPase subunit b
MADRKNRIAADLDGAEQARKAAEEMQNEYQSQLKNARAEAQVIVDKAVQQAEKETQAQLTAVREQINQEKDRARAEIANERESALREMREEVVSLSMAVAGKLLKKNMNNDLNAKLVADCIEKLDAQSVGR